MCEISNAAVFDELLNRAFRCRLIWRMNKWVYYFLSLLPIHLCFQIFFFFAVKLKNKMLRLVHQHLTDPCMTWMFFAIYLRILWVSKQCNNTFLIVEDVSLLVQRAFSVQIERCRVLVNTSHLSSAKKNRHKNIVILMLEYRRNSKGFSPDTILRHISNQIGPWGKSCFTLRIKLKFSRVVYGVQCNDECSDLYL